MYIALYVLYIVYQSIVKYILFLHRPLLFIHLLACHSSQYTFITGCLSATTKIQISQLWDFIETWGFREDLKSKILSPPTPPQKAHCATKIEISQLWDFIRDLGFSRGPQSQRPFACYPPTRLGLPQKAHCVTAKIQISQHWDFIETWDFCKFLKSIVLSPPTPSSPMTPPLRKHIVQQQKLKFLSFGTS